MMSMQPRAIKALGDAKWALLANHELVVAKTYVKLTFAPSPLNGVASAYEVELAGGGTRCL